MRDQTRLTEDEALVRFRITRKAVRGWVARHAKAVQAAVDTLDASYHINGNPLDNRKANLRHPDPQPVGDTEFFVTGGSDLIELWRGDRNPVGTFERVEDVAAAIGFNLMYGPMPGSEVEEPFTPLADPLDGPSESLDLGSFETEEAAADAAAQWFRQHLGPIPSPQDEEKRSATVH